MLTTSEGTCDNMETQKQINYVDELAKLTDGQGLNVWKVKQGKYKLEILEEPQDAQFVKDGGEVVQQWKIVCKVNGEAKTWFIPRSAGKNSIRGQLIKLATMKGNKLVGASFELLVVGENKERRYTIPETL